MYVYDVILLYSRYGQDPDFMLSFSNILCGYYHYTVVCPK